jgi:transposase
VRVYSQGHGRKTDKHDAVSIGLAALEGAGILQVACDDVTVSLRLLCDRREELAAQRTQAVCRLHRLLAELTPGGMRRELTANKAQALLPGSGPRTTSPRSGCISPVSTWPISVPSMPGSSTSRARSPRWSPRPAPR